MCLRVRGMPGFLIASHNIHYFDINNILSIIYNLGVLLLLPPLYLGVRSTSYSNSNTRVLNRKVNSVNGFLKHFNLECVSYELNQ